MKLTPASRALATIRDAVASFVGPPNIMVPRQIGEIFRPLRPSWRYCMGEFLTLTGGRIAPLRAQAKQSAPQNAMSGLLRRSCLLALEDLEHAARHCDATPVDGHFRVHEDQASGRADHAGPRDQGLADLSGLDEMHIKLDGGHGVLAGYVACGHAAGAIGKGHQHAPLHEAAAVVVLVLGNQRIFVMAVDEAMPQGTDQVDEPRRLDNAPAVGFEPCGGLVGHAGSSTPECAVISSAACLA